MVVEQVTDGFKQAVKLDDIRDTPSMTAQQSIRLQRPRSESDLISWYNESARLIHQIKVLELKHSQMSKTNRHTLSLRSILH